MLSQIKNFNMGRHTITKEQQLKKQKFFIEKSKFVHHDFYDYSLVEYKHSLVEVKIICPIHGEFNQTPIAHANLGNGCSKCAVSKKYIKDYLRPNVIKKERILSLFDILSKKMGELYSSKELDLMIQMRKDGESFDEIKEAFSENHKKF